MLRRILTAIAMTLHVIAIHADIKYVDNSFRAAGNSDREVSASDLGQHDMTAALSEMVGTYDDADKPSALVRVQFQDMSNDDIRDKITASVNNSHINKTQYLTNPQNGKIEFWVWVDPSEHALLTFEASGQGKGVRIPEINVEGGKVYFITLTSDERVTVTFDSNVAGTRVYLDGEPIGQIDDSGSLAKRENVSLGKHHVRYVSKNGTKEEEIEVSKSNTNFKADLSKKYTVNFKSNMDDVTLLENDVIIGVMPVKITVSEGPHTFVVRKNGYPDKEYPVNIGSNTTHEFPIHKFKDIEFTAMYNNSRMTADSYSKATLFVDHDRVGEMPYTMSLPYGRHHVRMSYLGREKQDYIDVNDHTPSNFSLNIPPQNRRFNPFDLEYRKREFGITAAYVQKWYRWKEDGQSASVNHNGEDSHINGFQIGVPVQPWLGSGFCVNTGLYFECYFEDVDIDYETFSLTEVSLNIPLGLMFRLPLSSQFSLFVQGGMSMDIGLAASLSNSDYDDIEVDYGDGFHRRCQFNYEYGGGLQFKALQLSFLMSNGLTNNYEAWTGEDYGKLYQRKMCFQLSIMF